MFDTSVKKRIPAGLLFLICALIGGACFLGIYGAGILDFTNTGWLLDNDHDLRQHYIGWCRFRSDPWHFPIGLIDSLSYPNSMSVIYTDSIPLFAVLFKLAGHFLPVSFQYFGLFGLISFMLMGGLSAILLRRFVSKDVECIIGSVFFVICPAVIQRMYFHTALGAQWIVILAMILWVYDDLIGSDIKRALYWGFTGFICVSIHSYFLPMAGMILAALMITQYVRKKSLKLPLAEFAAFCAAGLLTLFVLGAFYGGTSASGPGLGAFGSNLNTFINPWEIGKLMPELPLQNYFQYEGMAYLGAGILMLFVIVAAGIVVRRIRKVPEEAFHNEAIYGKMSLILAAVSFFSAILPNICFNEIQIVWIPYPGFVTKLLGIFRSNGRLVWTAMYILMTAAICFTAYTFRHYRVGTVILAGALMLQVYDMSDTFAEKYAYYTALHSSESVWDDPAVGEFVDGSKEFIFLYTDNDITMPAAYYGYIHDMRQNNFYFARDIDDKVNRGIEEYRSELKENRIRDGAVYVVKQEDYEKDRQFYDSLDAESMEASGHLLIKARKQ